MSAGRGVGVSMPPDLSGRTRPSGGLLSKHERGWPDTTPLDRAARWGIFVAKAKLSIAGRPAEPRCYGPSPRAAQLRKLSPTPINQEPRFAGE